MVEKLLDRTYYYGIKKDFNASKEYSRNKSIQMPKQLMKIFEQLLSLLTKKIIPYLSNVNNIIEIANAISEKIYEQRKDEFDKYNEKNYKSFKGNSKINALFEMFNTIGFVDMSLTIDPKGLESKWVYFENSKAIDFTLSIILRHKFTNRLFLVSIAYYETEISIIQLSLFEDFIDYTIKHLNGLLELKYFSVMAEYALLMAERKEIENEINEILAS